MKVTFETKCYHRDWRFLIKDDLLQRMIDNCNYKFEERILYINNFPHYSAIKSEADKLVSKDVIDKYVIVEEYASEALSEFGLDYESFKDGYYYSIAELVSIYLCATPYLLHFSSDSILESNSVDWIEKAVTRMENDESTFVANPTWNENFAEAKQESFDEDDDWYYSFGFSDQAYLIRTADFKNQIYNERNPMSERYPTYGGELFEKRVDAYMRNHGLRRITNKHVSYSHVNFPNSTETKTFWQRVAARFQRESRM